MKLTEILKTAYEYRLQDAWRDDDWEGVFTTDAGENVQVYFSSRKSYSVYGIDFRRGGRYNMTGGGDALKIFATVLAIIDDFIKQRDPAGFFFAADKNERSRVTLYDRLVKRYTAAGGFVDVTDDLDRLKDENTREWFAMKIDNDDREELKLIVKKELLHEAD